MQKTKVIILQELYDHIARQSQTQLYGCRYPAEGLLQVWDTKAQPGLQQIGMATSINRTVSLEIEDEQAELEIIAYDQEFAARAAPIINTSDLRLKRVSLVGLGSVGSNIALYLAQSSVGAFRLIDMDRLSAANISRHACTLRDLGRYKTQAVADMIGLRNPRAHIETFIDDFEQLSFEKQIERLKGSDLVIASTDSNAVQFLVNEVCYRQGMPSLYIGCYERACGGEIIYCLPGKTACFSCHVGFRRTALRDVRPREKRLPYSSKEKGPLQAEPGLSIDIGYVLSIAAAYALALLEPESVRAHILDYSKAMTLVHAGSLPQKKYARIFKIPFDLIHCSVRRDTQCEVCGMEGTKNE